MNVLYCQPSDISRIERELAHAGLIRLGGLPPGFLNILIALKPSCFVSSERVPHTKDVFEKLYNLVRLRASKSLV